MELIINSHMYELIIQVAPVCNLGLMPSAASVTLPCNAVDMPDIV